MLRNIIGQIFNAKNGIFLFLFLENIILPAERRRFLKNNSNKKGIFGQIFNSKKGNFWTEIQLYSTQIYIYIYICAVELLSGPSLAFSGVIIWSKFVFLNTVCQKHYKNRGFSTCFEKKSCAQKNSGVIIWSKFAFLKRTQLGPDNNPYLDQIITPQMYFFVFCCFKNVLKYLFYSAFENQQILATNAPKNDNFSHFAKHRLLKKRYVATPLLTKNW